MWSTATWTYEPKAVTRIETRTRPMTSEEAQARTPRPTDSVKLGDWKVTSVDSQAKAVTESREVITTPCVWDPSDFAWKESAKHAKVTAETRTRAMTAEEIDSILPQPDPVPAVSTKETPAVAQAEENILAWTGAKVMGLAYVALIAVLVGAALLLGRRRKRR